MGDGLAGSGCPCPCQAGCTCVPRGRAECCCCMQKIRNPKQAWREAVRESPSCSCFGSFGCFAPFSCPNAARSSPPQRGAQILGQGMGRDGTGGGHPSCAGSRVPGAAPSPGHAAREHTAACAPQSIITPDMFFPNISVPAGSTVRGGNPFRQRVPNQL